jgi:hypothetical protein
MHLGGLRPRKIRIESIRRPELISILCHITIHEGIKIESHII